MADKEKIKAEIERLKSIADYQLDNCKVDKSAWSQQAEVCKKLLSFINSMPEEPFKENRTSYDIGFYSGYKKCKEDYKAKERACKPIDDSDISCNAELCFAITGCKYYNPNKKSNVNHCIGGLPLQLMKIKMEESDRLIHSVTKISDQEESESEDRLRKASKEYLKVLSETPYNNTPVTNAQIIIKELIGYLDNPSKYDPNHVTDISEDLLDEIQYRWEDDPHTKWPKCPYNDFKNIACHFANWQKQQMIKNVTYGEVSQCATYPYNLKIQSIKTIDKDLKVGDKVRLIIFKEE